MEGFVTVNIELEEMLVHVSTQHSLKLDRKQTPTCLMKKKKKSEIAVDGLPFVKNKKTKSKPLY